MSLNVFDLFDHHQKVFSNLQSSIFLKHPGIFKYKNWIMQFEQTKERPPYLVMKQQSHSFSIINMGSNM